MDLLRFRKILAFSATAALLITGGPVSAALAAEDTEADSAQIAAAGETLIFPYAKAAILIEANTGKILFQQNADTPLPPASTTKILTTLLAVDSAADAERPRVVSAAAAGVGESSLGLREGEVLSLNELISGALVHSGNDACYAIGEVVAGSEPFFVHWLNVKAAVLGAFSTRAANTNGLPDDTHLMSAGDLAIFSRYLLERPFLAKTVASKYVQLGQDTSFRSYKNTNKLLWQDENVIGIKTGTTDEAGPCLAAAYQSGSARYISVVLNSPDRYGESYSLLRYAASRYVLVDFPCGGTVLACLPQNGGWRRLKAVSDLRVLVDREDGAQLFWQWSFAGDRGRLALVDSSGAELAAVDLRGE